MTMTGHTEEEAAHPFGKKCRGEKRVSFPPDEEMVSGFAESRDTLRDGELLFCSTEPVPHSFAAISHISPIWENILFSFMTVVTRTNLFTLLIC